ncbi:MAG: sugar ABC transporter permease [Clostridia bacterium]|nr:sugar ABC transporter permease [Clostridia bacterium]
MDTNKTVTAVGNHPRSSRLRRRLRRERELWILSAFILVWLAVICYYPMYGLIIAFKYYVPGKPFFTAKWVGLKYFSQFINGRDFPIVMRNTLAISGLNILFGFPAPILLALLLNELKNKHYKSVVQTVSYLPHFISWVVAASLLFSILNSEGFLNKILVRAGIIEAPINWLSKGEYFWGILTTANIWKGVGFSSIIYLSAIAGIDEELYQAGAVDGLNRTGSIWHITLPGIRTTVVLLGILQIGSILNAGFQQQLLLGTTQTRKYYEVIDTYAYKYGVQNNNYSYGTAVGLMKGVISVTLVLLANRISKKVMDIAVL